MIRIAKKQQRLWKFYIYKFLERHPLPNSNTTSSIDVETVKSMDSAKLVSKAGKSMEIILSTMNGYFANRRQTQYHRIQINDITTQQQDQQQPIYMELYRYILSNFIKYTSPLFYMPSNDVFLGKPIGLHFFEMRYRLLISEVMSSYPESFRNGGPISRPISRPINTEEDNDDEFEHPKFIYANNAPLKPGTIVTIVRVVRCEVYPDHRADVVLLPDTYARVESVWMRPNSHNLYEAKVVRMNNEEVSAEVERIVLSMYPAASYHNMNNNSHEGDEGNNGENNRNV